MTSEKIPKSPSDVVGCRSLCDCLSTRSGSKFAANCYRGACNVLGKLLVVLCSGAYLCSHCNGASCGGSIYAFVLAMHFLEDSCSKAVILNFTAGNKISGIRDAFMNTSSYQILTACKANATFELFARRDISNAVNQG